jgi:hypothetical protein
VGLALRPDTDTETDVEHRAMLPAADAVLDGDGLEHVTAGLVGAHHEDQLRASLPTRDVLGVDDEAGHRVQVGEAARIRPAARCEEEVLALGAGDPGSDDS